MPYSLILDIVVAVLLLVMIPYVIRLNRRLGMLRRDKAQLEKLAMTFAESTKRADESLGNLRASAEDMQRKLNSARTLHDDLAFLLDRGEKAADRLEEMVRASRTMGSGPKPVEQPTASTGRAPASAGPASQPGREPNVTTPENDVSHSEAERELLRALRSAN